MARKAGAPANFSLKDMGIEKPEEEIEAVEIGDFLEEEDARPVKPVIKNEPASQEAKTPTPPSSKSITETKQREEQPASRSGGRRSRPAQRIRMPQVSIREDTDERLKEITALMVQYGPQRDLKGSEVLDALVNALYDARKHLELQGVGRRGQWGSPQADAFLLQLKEAVIRTIEGYADSRR